MTPQSFNASLREKPEHNQHHSGNLNGKNPDFEKIYALAVPTVIFCVIP